MMNISTSITLLRIAAIPAVLIFYSLPFHWASMTAALLFMLAAFTDWLDGFLARMLSQSTRFGAFLDPVADKLLVSISLIAILGKQASMGPALAVAIIVGRELFVSALREWMAILGKRASVKVIYLGKIKTFAQMLAIVLLLSCSTYGPALGVWIGWGLLWIAAVLTLCSMFTYLRLAWPDLTLLKEGE